MTRLRRALAEAGVDDRRSGVRQVGYDLQQSREQSQSRSEVGEGHGVREAAATVAEGADLARRPGTDASEDRETSSDLIAALNASRSALASSEARQRAIFDSAIDFAMIVTDPAGLVTDWNTGAEHVLGWTAAEMRGQDVGRWVSR